MKKYNRRSIIPLIIGILAFVYFGIYLIYMDEINKKISGWKTGTKPEQENIQTEKVQKNDTVKAEPEILSVKTAENNTKDIQNDTLFAQSSQSTSDSTTSIITYYIDEKSGEISTSNKANKTEAIKLDHSPDKTPIIEKKTSVNEQRSQPATTRSDSDAKVKISKNNYLTFTGDNGLYGFKDASTNEILVTPQYNSFKRINNASIFIVKRATKYGIIDIKSHSIITPFIYEEIEKSDSGKLLILKKRSGNKYSFGIANISTGQIIGKDSYEYISEVTPSLMLVKENNLFGCIDNQGRIVIPSIYKSFSGVDRSNKALQIKLVDTKGQTLVFDTKGQIIN